MELLVERDGPVTELTIHGPYSYKKPVLILYSTLCTRFQRNQGRGVLSWELCISSFSSNSSNICNCAPSFSILDSLILHSINLLHPTVVPTIDVSHGGSNRKWIFIITLLVCITFLRLYQLSRFRCARTITKSSYIWPS